MMKLWQIEVARKSHRDGKLFDFVLEFFGKLAKYDTI